MLVWLWVDYVIAKCRGVWAVDLMEYGEPSYTYIESSDRGHFTGWWGRRGT